MNIQIGKAVLAISLLLGLALGCKRDDVRVYDVPKEKKAGLPEGWRELPASQMRVANYAVAGTNNSKAEVTVVSLPGMAGSELDNVNRWRGQVGLQAIEEGDLAKEAKEIQIAGTPARLFEMSGSDAKTQGPARLVAAVQKHGDSTWFFKMSGDEDLVRQQRDAFVAFFAKYQFPDAPAPQETPHPVSDVRPQGEKPRRTWKTPAGWQQQHPGPMQDAKYLAGDGKAMVTVSIFEGPTGGVLANVNRWRTQQLELPAVDEAALGSLLTPLDLPDSKANLVDMNGPKQRMVAAIVPRGSQTWFFKLVGEDAVVGAEKNGFVEFVKSSK